MANSVSRPLGPLMIDVEGTTLSSKNIEQLQHPLIGGLILFSRNYHSRGQLGALVDTVHQLRTPKLLIAVDQEGGRVQRLRDGFQRLPPAELLGKMYDLNISLAIQTAESFGWVMASELRELDIDISFAPVLDVPHVPSKVIGNRAFHYSPEGIIALAGAYIKGMQQAGMSSVGKHFPGHGGVAGDSHLMLPVDNRNLTELKASDLLPYKALIPNGLGGIMTAHVIFSAQDNEPPTFSSYWLQQVLRQQLGFDGVIFSDDLSMEGAKKYGPIVNRATAALEAGCDMILVCNDPDSVAELISELNYDQEQYPNLARRLQALCPSNRVNQKGLFQSSDWRMAIARLESLNETSV